MMKKELSKIDIAGKGIGDFFSTLPNYKRIIILLFIIISIISIFPIKVLIANDYRTENYIKSWRIKSQDKFIIEYTHSVERSPVTEIYIINDNSIILLESYFHSLGAGLPATTPYSFEITDEGFRIYDVNKEIEYLVYRTGAQRANHNIQVNDKKYNFLDFSDPRTGVKLTTGKLTLLSYIIKEGFN